MRLLVNNVFIAKELAFSQNCQLNLLLIRLLFEQPTNIILIAIRCVNLYLYLNLAFLNDIHEELAIVVLLIDVLLGFQLFFDETDVDSLE